MVTMRRELLDATDETIEDAVEYADPMVLRGLLYQLTADESLTEMDLGAQGRERGGAVTTVTDPSDIALIRSRAVAFLKSYRDSGAGELPIGPIERLPVSLSLTGGSDIPTVELEMWLEQLAIDPYARGLVWSQPPERDRLADISVVVIGAGMGGLNAAVQLAHAGVSFTVLEKNGEVGGTWYENRYPGTRVDTPSRTYTHIFGANFIYPSEYCAQSENEKYVNWVADQFDIRSNIEFHTEVRSIIWDDVAKLWEITADQPDGERVFRTNIVITAVGFLSRPNVPEIPGAENFEGLAFHSARWPDDLDLSGKRVAVIGSGCTAYQLVPEIAGEVEHLCLFQRTPSWVFDTPNYLGSYPDQVNWLDRNFPYFSNFVRFHQTWLRRPQATRAFNEVDPDFKDPYAVSAENKAARDKRIAFMRSKFGDDEELVEKMTPPGPPGATRPVIVDPTYSIFDALLRENVSLVTNGIAKISANGVVTEDGTEHAADVIVFATGFRANDYLWPMEIRGRNGTEVQDLWSKDGARAYLGNMLPGFPNFFMVYGPNTNANVGFAVIHMQELVTRFMLGCIDALVTRDKKTVDVTTDAYFRYNSALDEAAARRIYDDPRVHSYFKNKFGRCATNGAFDGRLMWNWLRDPSEPGLESDRLDERFLETSRVISPYFGHDLVLE